MRLARRNSLSTLATTVLDAAARHFPRVHAQRWACYAITLARTGPSEDESRLARLEERALPDLSCALPECTSVRERWARGFRDAYVWYDDGLPRALQWLFTSADNSRLRALPAWAGMYQPLASGVGHLGKLWLTESARREGLATRFMLAMFAMSRARGLRVLHMHVPATDRAARLWARRTGWSPAGTISRGTIDAPGLRDERACLFVHLPGAIGDEPTEVRDANEIARQTLLTPPHGMPLRPPA